MSGMDLTAMIVAAIAIIPATIAAIAATRGRRDIRTNNGKTVGETVHDSAATLEIIQAQQHSNASDIIEVHTRLGRIETKVDRIDGRVDHLDDKLEDHLDEMRVRIMEHDEMVQRLKKQEEEQ